MDFILYIIIAPLVVFLLDHGVAPLHIVIGFVITFFLMAITIRLNNWLRETKRHNRSSLEWEPTVHDEVHAGTVPIVSPGNELTWHWSSDENGYLVGELESEEPAKQQREPEVEFLRKRLEEELRHKWAAQSLILEPPAARIVGRVARLEPHDPEATHKALWLAFPDNDDKYQAVKVRGLIGDLSMVSEGDALQVALTWKYGRLTLTDIEEHITADILGPMPEVKLPDPKPKGASSKDGKLPTMDDLDKAASEGEWGSLNHSVYRFQVAVHITMSPKYRAKSFEGRAIEVQAVCREVAETEGLNVIALAAEEDHLHLLGIPAGKGGCPPTWQWSRWVGRFKALTSKRLKSLPGLEAFQWQTGYALTAVHGGKQSSEESLEVVKRYVMSQGQQEVQEGSLDTAEGSEEAEG